MFRIGQSTDIHAFACDRDLILGGVKIDHDRGLLGHSDADALLHAVSEAILGALALGDLGKHFPDNSDATLGMDSMVILQEVVKLMDECGYEINNMDCLIMIERPKMAPHIEKMRANIATCCHCDINAVSVKATRGEKLGFIGREEGVACQAIVLLKKKEG